jgi:hypothetical protein
MGFYQIAGGVFSKGIEKKGGKMRLKRKVPLRSGEIIV